MINSQWGEYQYENVEKICLGQLIYFPHKIVIFWSGQGQTTDDICFVTLGFNGILGGKIKRKNWENKGGIFSVPKLGLTKVGAINYQFISTLLFHPNKMWHILLVCLV